jgi:hypothetical protein
VFRSRSRRNGRPTGRRPVVGALLLALFATPVLPSSVAEAARPGAPDSADTKVSRVHPVTGLGAKKDRERVARDKKANQRLITQARAERRVAWPEPGTAHDSLATRATGSVVDVTAVKSGKGRASGEASVRILSRKATQQAGITGLLFTVGTRRPGAARLTVDYKSFASAATGPPGWAW